MRKLVIVVIALSFLGYGPLKSLFHSAKESANELQLSEQKKSANFLITENNSDSQASKTGAGVIVQFDQKNHKIKAGSVLLSVIKPVGSTPNFKELKLTVQKNYGVSIDHIFMLNPSSVSKIIDQLAPDGVKIKGVNNPLHGKDVLTFILQEAVNPENTEDLKTILSSLKKAIKHQSSDKLLSITPSIINEAVNSVSTDLGKGQLVGLGISAIMNPITKIEPLQFAKGNEKKDSATVNSILEDKRSKAIIN